MSLCVCNRVSEGGNDVWEGGGVIWSLHTYNGCSFLEGCFLQRSHDEVRSSWVEAESLREGEWIRKGEEKREGKQGGGGSFRTAEERSGRWEEEGGRGGPNMTCVSVC